MIDGVRALEGVAGFVEAPRFYPYLSGRKNLELVAALDGGDARSQIDDGARHRRPRDRAKDRVGGYSHGMRQRLGIAGALIRRPRLLLLDEPATGLDPAGMRDMRALIRALADSGITVLLSSHLMNEVEELCNRVAIIRAGRDRLRGPARRAARLGCRQLRAAHVRRRARRCRSARATRASRDVASRRTASASRARRGAVAELSLALAEAGLGIRALVPRRGVARGAVLPADRGRRRERAAPAARFRELERVGVMPATRPDGLPLGAAQARRAEAHVPRPRARRSIVPLIFIVALALQNGAPERRPVRPLRARHGPGHPARRS